MCSQNLFTKSDENIDEYVKFNKLDIIARHAWSSDETLDLFSDLRNPLKPLQSLLALPKQKLPRVFIIGSRTFTVLETYMKCQKP